MCRLSVRFWRFLRILWRLRVDLEGCGGWGVTVDTGRVCGHLHCFVAVEYLACFLIVVNVEL